MRAARCIPALGLLLLTATALPALPRTAGAAEGEDGTVYNVTLQQNEQEKRFAVSTLANWTQNEQTGFTVTFAEKAFTQNYLAIAFTVEKLGGDWFPVRIGAAEGSYFNEGEEGGVNIAKALPDGGQAFDVEQKFGHWFLIPGDFSGTLFLPRAICTTDGEPAETLSSLSVQYDSGDVSTHAGTVSFRSLSLADEAAEGPAEELFDFTALQTDEEGVVEDPAFRPKALFAVNRAESESYLVCEGAELNASMENGLKMGVKTASAGGSEVLLPYEYGWTEILTSFEPADGLALTVLGVSYECFFRVYVEDENGAVFKPLITTAGPEAPETFSFTSDGIQLGLHGYFGCFHLLKDEFGTLYVPFRKFIPVTAGEEFMGGTLPASQSMGRIVKIHLGMDMRYGLGRTMGFGAFGNVALKGEGEGSVTLVADLAAMTNGELNVSDPSAGSKVRSLCTPAHLANWTWERLGKRDIPTYIDKSTLEALIGLCEGMKEADHDADSWRALQSKLTIARAVSENAFATQQQVDAAREALSKQRFSMMAAPNTKGGSSLPVILGVSMGGGAAVLAAVAAVGAVVIKRRKKQ